MTAVAEKPATEYRTGRHRAARVADGGAAPQPEKRSVVARIAGAVTTLLLVGTGVLLLATTVGPRVLHYRTASMLTGSMAPKIKPGDVIVDTEENATDVKVGQIITYHIPVDDHRVESHRVVWVGRDRDGAVLFRTKGDANTGNDPWTARISGRVWQVRAVVPGAGAAIRFLRRPLVAIALTRVLPVLLVAMMLLSIWRPRKSPRRRSEVG
jgi:signal peptidase